MNYTESLKGKDYKQLFSIIDTFVVFDNPNNYSSGVYQIEDFYIGRSGNFKARITDHVFEALNNPKHNLDKLYLICRTLKTRKLKVKILSNNQDTEKSYIENLYNTLPLINIEFVSNAMRDCRRRLECKLIEGKELNITLHHYNNQVVAELTVKNRLIFRFGSSASKAKQRLLVYLNSFKKVRNRAAKNKNNKRKKK